ANVANLLLARISSRRTELAVRAALGAGRGQLVRQVLAESFVLSGIGGALGVLVAWAGVRFVHALPEGSLPRMNDVRLDAGVLLFAVVVSLVVALIFGLVPALQASRAGLRDTVSAFGTTTAVSGTRVLSALIVVEVALALVLLVGAGLMTRSFAQLMRVAPGFEPSNLLAVQVYLPQTKYKDAASRMRFYKEALGRIDGLPGVRSAAAVSALPMYPVGIDFALPFTIEGKAAPTNGEEPRADIRIATPRYFETMKIPMVKGRSIDERDLPGRPGAMVINETMARRYFPGEDPIGRVVRNPHGTAEVVGISGDVKHYGLDGGPRAELFMPAWQQPLNGMAFVVRTASDPTNFIEPIRRSIAAIDAEQPIFDSSAMVDVVARSVFLPRISMVLLATFAALALVLAVVGIFGVVSYSVAERTREIGVRMALGANAGDTLRLVLGRSMALVAAGTVVGLIAAVALTRAITGLLYEVSPLDPIVFVGVSIVLAAAGLLASVIPARRATRVGPVAQPVKGLRRSVAPSRRRDRVRATLALARRSTVRTTHDASSIISIACPRTRPQACGRVWRLASCVVSYRRLTDGSRCARSRAARTLVQPLRAQTPRRRRASWSGGAAGPCGQGACAQDRPEHRRRSSVSACDVSPLEATALHGAARISFRSRTPKKATYQ
ncbi:MAG: hypothetical protein DMG01_08660, partial [Acidobacteria bacterium]